MGRREEPAELAFERAEVGRGVVVVVVGLLLRAESTESLLLLFAGTEVAAGAGALKLGPTVFAPPTNTELAVLPLLTVGRRMVEGKPNPKILRFFCATPPTPKCAPAPADPSVRDPTGLALNAPTSKLDVDRRSVDASLACPCAESLTLVDFDFDDLDFFDFFPSSAAPSASSAFLLFFFSFFSFPSFFPTVPSFSLFSFFLSFFSFTAPAPSSSIAPLNCAQLPILASDRTLRIARSAIDPCP
jgi:hypothetical protein